MYLWLCSHTSSYLHIAMSSTWRSSLHALWESHQHAAVTNHIISGEMVTECDVRGKLSLYPRDIFAHVWHGETFRRFFLLVPYREPQQGGLNLTPYIGRNVLCGRLPAFIRAAMSPCELCCWLLRDFIKIGGERQWSYLSLIYSISLPCTETVCSDGCYLWSYRRRNWTLMGHWGLMWKCSSGQRG